MVISKHLKGISILISIPRGKVKGDVYNRNGKMSLSTLQQELNVLLYMNFKIALNKLQLRSKPRRVNVAISFQIHFNQSESILKYHPDVINSFQKFQSFF